MHKLQVRLVHETNPQKYFPALFSLSHRHDIDLVGAHRYSVIKEWLRSGLKSRTSMASRTRNSAADLVYRLRSPLLSGEIVVAGFAPWDWRVVFLLAQSRRNKIVYHTSWHDWGSGRVPRRYGPLTGLTRRLWLRLFQTEGLEVVAVLDQTALQLRERFALKATVIPHAVPGSFFDAASQRQPRANGDEFRIVYVGELSTKKGVGKLLALHRQLEEQEVPVRTTLIGDGPLRSMAAAEDAASESIRYLGPIADRHELAAQMADNDLLVLLSQRQPDWEELFGIVVAEAIAAGLAVMATRHVGPVAILGPQNPGLVDDGHDPHIAELVARIAKSPAAYEALRLSQQGLADRYRQDVVEAEWLRLLKEVGARP